MRAIILAAGRGSRLGRLTEDRPKCLVELAGHPLLHHQLRSLRANGLVDVAVVTGYRGESLDDWPVAKFHNPTYATTNMVTSLFAARDWFGAEDLLMCYGDIVYEPTVVAAAISADASVAVVIDSNWRALWEARMADPLADAETLMLDIDGRILEIGQRACRYEEIQGQYIGMIRFSREAIGELCAAWDRFTFDFGFAEAARISMTEFLQWLIATGWQLQSVSIDGGWLELDSVQDYELYQGLLARGELSRFYRFW